jgi:aminoglycoside phosphotransferase (APT) family kinase protein
MTKTPGELQAAVQQFLRRQWPDDMVTIEGFAPIPGGYSRETYRFDAKVMRGGGSAVYPMILRKDPPPAVAIVDSDRAIEHEIINRVRTLTDLPVTRSHFVEPDPETFGTPAMILERAEGFGEPSALFNGGPNSDQAVSVVTDLCERIATLHTTSLDTLNADGLLNDTRRIGMDVSSWQAYMDATFRFFFDIYDDMSFDAIPVFRDALTWMRRTQPRPLPLTVVHGDFNPSNFLYKDGRVTALIDWEVAHIGDPREDLGWMAQMDLLSNTAIMSTPTEHGSFLDYYNKLTGFDVTEEEIHYFRMFTSSLIGSSVLPAVKRRALKEHDELLHYYIIQPATVSILALAQMLGCPMPAPEAN